MTTGYYETSFLLFANARGGRDTINYQMPGPRDSSCNKCPGFAGGGGGCSRLELTRTLRLVGSISGMIFEFPVKRNFKRLLSRFCSPVTHASVWKLLAPESSILTFKFIKTSRARFENNPPPDLNNNFPCGLCLSIVALTTTMCLYNVCGGGRGAKK